VVNLHSMNLIYHCFKQYHAHPPRWSRFDREL